MDGSDIACPLPRKRQPGRRFDSFGSKGRIDVHRPKQRLQSIASLALCEFGPTLLGDATESVRYALASL
jgi:hypothetical protein